MRRKLVAGNWKMNYLPSKAAAFAAEMKDKLNSDKVDVALCVPFVSLEGVKNALSGSNVKVGAQNMHFLDEGAYTGEVSAPMLQEMGVPYVIIGHSERREMFGETDETVNKKIHQALKYGITPILCIGESFEEREENRTNDVLSTQVTVDFAEISAADVAKVVIAYEPIWAIGVKAKRPATTEEAEDACKFVREKIASLYSGSEADKIRILYGGSVSDTTASELFNQPNIDGGLVGGASMKPSFEKVVHYDN